MIYKINGVAVKWEEFLNELNTLNYEIVCSEDEENLVPSNRHRIEGIKAQLASMDYKTSKHADGEYTEEQWAAIVAERKALRAEINKLEEGL